MEKKAKKGFSEFNAKSHFCKELYKKIKDEEIEECDNQKLQKTTKRRELVKKIEEIEIQSFNKMSRSEQIFILIDYGYLKNMVNRNAGKYFLNTQSVDVLLEQDNFDSLLYETAIKTINNVNLKYNKVKVKSKINIKNKLKNDYDTMGAILGFFTSAYQINAKKAYVPFSTEKRRNMKSAISLHSVNAENEEYDLEEKLPSVSSSSNYENDKTLKMIDKVLKTHDAKNLTHLSVVFQELLNDDKHTNIAKKLALNNYGLKNKIKDITTVLEKENLLESLELALLSKTEEFEKLEIIPDFKSIEKAVNPNFVSKRERFKCEHYIDINLKDKTKSIVCVVIDKQHIDKYKRVVEHKVEEIKINIPCDIEESDIQKYAVQQKETILLKYL